MKTNSPGEGEKRRRPKRCESCGVTIDQITWLCGSGKCPNCRPEQNSAHGYSEGSEVPKPDERLYQKCNCYCHTSGAMHIMACCDNGYVDVTDRVNNWYGKLAAENAALRKEAELSKEQLVGIKTMSELHINGYEKLCAEYNQERDALRQQNIDLARVALSCDALQQQLEQMKSIFAEAVDAGREAQLMVNLLQSSGVKLNSSKMAEYKKLYESCAIRTRKINNYNDAVLSSGEKKPETKP